jgi:cyclase
MKELMNWFSRHFGNRESRKTLIDWIAATINIPFTVGCGISSVKDVDVYCKMVPIKYPSIHRQLKNPQLINDLAQNLEANVL